MLLRTNAGFIALETDADPDNADMQAFLGYAEIIFCVLFSVELLVRSAVRLLGLSACLAPRLGWIVHIFM